MNQEWNNIEFKFGNNPGIFEQLAVVEYGSRQTLMENLKDRPQAKETLSEELKKIKKEDGVHDPKSLKIPFEGKGALNALIHMGDAGSFFLQTALRKAFLSVLTPGEENKEIQVSLRGLKESSAKLYLNWIVSLAMIARYRPEVFGKKAEEKKKFGKVTVQIDTGLNKKQAESIVEEGRILGLANNQVKYLAELPSNVLHPKSYREKAAALAKELKVEFEFLGKKELIKKGAGAFLAVVQGDHHERAGIAHLIYRGGKKAKKKVAIVGKGLCYDTGGYNVKVGTFMHGMHQDMTGSAVALSLFQALVELKVDYEVHAYLALAENLISFDAYRPNDVVVACNGLSIEVDNTDAEGRMCLSDTLAIASEQKPDLIIDYATLTGSVIRSLDTRRSGAYSNVSKLSSLAVEVGEKSGERVWNFPIGGDYNDAIKSEYADVRQCATSVAADHIYAATFLSKFVAKDIPWIHIDLAASGNKGGLGLVPTEATGFGVRFGLELIRDYLKG
jgi:leucyl aminopeptidase